MDRILKKIDPETLALLLSLSQDIATIKNKKDLLQVIHSKLKTVLPFNDAVINVIHDDGKTQSPYLLDVDTNRLTHPDYEDASTRRYPFPDGVFEKVLHSDDPIVFDVKTQLRKKAAPYYINFIDQTGVKELIGMRLTDNGIAFGVFYLQLEQKDVFVERHHHILRVVASQLQAAIANLLSYQRIEQREKENAILLSISNAINSSKTKEDLLRIIKKDLQQMFMFQEIVIALLNQDRMTHSAVIYSTLDKTQAQPDYQQTVQGKYPVDDGIYDECLLNGKTLVLDMDDLVKRDNAPGYVKFFYTAQTREMIVLPLTVAEQKIGCLYLLSERKGSLTQAQLKLVENITTYLSVGVANILAQERVEQQLIEINSYRQQLEFENNYLQEEISAVINSSDIIGNSEPMVKIHQLIDRVASTDSTVLILGETGTGKELIARAIHNQSSRKDKLLVKVNCATLPANLIESELFGHEKGSFTGAVEKRIGKFELANHGTLFLDEIGEMPLDLQVKLLRALQEKEIERIGGKSVIKVDVRIISATNRNLEREVHAGKFRSDLYYRLNVFPLTLPPLRERTEDIPALASHFTGRFARREGKNITNISSSALQSLISYAWPGNVRELEHIIERSVLLNTGRVLKDITLPVPMKERKHGNEFIVKTWIEFEKEYLLAMLKYTNGKVSGPGGAAELLGLRSTTLSSRMKKLGISRHFS